MRRGGVEVLEDGTVVDYYEDDTPEVQGQRKEFAAFKFSLLETIAADPKKPSPYCVSILVQFSRFANFKTRQAYLSITSMMILCDIKSRTTAIKCRDWIIKEGYLEAVPGETGEDGEQIYKLCNPRLLDVQDHVRDAIAKRNEDTARAKREYRKRQALIRGSSEIGPPETEWGFNNCTDGCPENEPNTLDDTSDIILYENESNYQGWSYASVKAGDDDKIPYPIPENRQEADYMLSEICRGFDPPAVVVTVLRGKLMRGELSRYEADLNLMSWISTEVAA